MHLLCRLCFPTVLSCLDYYCLNMVTVAFRIVLAGGSYCYGGASIPCKQSSYSDPGAASCSSCSDPAMAGWQCSPGGLRHQCRRGYYGKQLKSDQWVCELCERGTFNNATGTTSCLQCKDGQDSPMGSESESDCGFKVLVHPQDMQVEMSPDDDASRHKLLVVNTGGTAIDWTLNMTTVSYMDWVQPSHVQGSVNKSSYVFVNLSVSFLEELANQTSDPTWFARVNIGEHHEPIKLTLKRKPGRFSAERSIIDSSSLTQPAVGQPVRMTVQTRDRYGQDRRSSANLGDRMRLNVSSATWSCNDVCGRDCANEECCCQDNFDGTYSSAFTPKQAGDYKVQVVADGQVLR